MAAQQPHLRTPGAVKDTVLIAQVRAAPQPVRTPGAVLDTVLNAIQILLYCCFLLQLLTLASMLASAATHALNTQTKSGAIKVCKTSLKWGVTAGVAGTRL